ncbi:HEAT repeat-containing protein 2 [Gonapodya sp. JEL0774]|nr:HEAT repeat-containing protein 2 [Gonapodya sp. JEL0774]
MNTAIAGSTESDASSLAADAAFEAARILQTLQRDLNVLADSQLKDRSAKRRALDKIRKETVDRAPSSSASKSNSSMQSLPSLPSKTAAVQGSGPATSLEPVAFEMLFTELAPGIVRCFADSTERTREAAIALPSEEVRLSLVRLVASIVGKISAKDNENETDEDAPGVGPYVDEVVAVITAGLADTFPEVKKESSKLLSNICSLHRAGRRLRPHIPELTKQVIPLLGYRHATVRAAGVQALRSLMIHDAVPLTDSDLSLSDHLRRLALDPSPQVRESLYRTCGSWLLELPDRYSVGWRFLSIVVGGCADQAVNLATACRGYLREAGLLYEKEWPDRVKDQLDYERVDASRPGIGLRHLARDNAQKTVATLVEGLRSWQPEARVRDARAMWVFLDLLEENATGYVHEIVKASVATVAEEGNPTVVDEVLRSSRLLGLHVNPSTLVAILLPYLDPAIPSSSSTRRGALRVLAAVASGTPTDKLKCHHNALAAALSNSECAGNENPVTLWRVAECVGACCGSSTISMAGRPEHTQGELNTLLNEEEASVYYGALARVAAVSGGMDERVLGVPEAKREALQALSRLAVATGLGDCNELHCRFLPHILSSLVGTTQRWTRHSSEPSVARYALLNAGDAVGELESLNKVLEMVEIGSKEEKEYEVRENVLTTLHALLSKEGNPLDSRMLLPTKTGFILNQILLPNSVWRPGKNARILRRLTMQVMLAWIKAPCKVTHLEHLEEQSRREQDTTVVGSLSLPVIQEHLAQLVTAINNNLEDDDLETRKASVGCWNEIWERFGKNLKFSADQLKLIYPELLKRLDDAHDDLRIIVAGRTWPLFFLMVERWQVQATEEERAAKERGGEKVYVETSLDDVHWKEMCKALAIHMDDGNSAMKDDDHAVALAVPRPPAPQSEPLREAVADDLGEKDYNLGVQEMVKNSERVGRMKHSSRRRAKYSLKSARSGDMTERISDKTGREDAVDESYAEALLLDVVVEEFHTNGDKETHKSGDSVGREPSAVYNVDRVAGSESKDSKNDALCSGRTEHGTKEMQDSLMPISSGSRRPQATAVLHPTAHSHSSSLTGSVKSDSYETPTLTRLSVIGGRAPSSSQRRHHTPPTAMEVDEMLHARIEASYGEKSARIEEALTGILSSSTTPRAGPPRQDPVDRHPLEPKRCVIRQGALTAQQFPVTSSYVPVSTPPPPIPADLPQPVTAELAIETILPFLRAQKQNYVRFGGLVSKGDPDVDVSVMVEDRTKMG